MNVLHLNSEVGWRGGEQQLAYLVEETSSRINNFVLCRQGSALAQHCQAQKIQHLSLRLTRGISLREAVSLKRACQQRQIDLIHAHGSKTHTMAVLSATLGNKVPIVLSRRVAFPIRQNLLTRWKYNHSAVKKIICISEAVRQVVASSVSHPERLVVVYSGIDTQRFGASSGYLDQRYPAAAGSLRIGTIAALSDSKDLYTFLDTAAIICTTHPSCHFFIIGEGPERPGLERYIVERQLQSRVTLTGFLTNVATVLPELDIFLMTPKTEGLGTSVLDAFACRVPVVATRAGGIPEMVVHEETGLLANVGDANTLATHLRRIMDTSSLAARLTEAAYQRLCHHFTKQKMAQRTLAVYASVLKKSEFVP